MYINVNNPFGTDSFAAPAPVEVKPHTLPKTKRRARVIRAPKAPSTILRNVLLTW